MKNKILAGLAGVALAVGLGVAAPAPATAASVTTICNIGSSATHLEYRATGSGAWYRLLVGRCVSGAGFSLNAPSGYRLRDTNTGLNSPSMYIADKFHHNIYVYRG